VQEREPLQVRLNVDGNPHVMHIPFGADVPMGVAHFAQQLGLNEESKQALTKQVQWSRPAPTLALTPSLLLSLHEFKCQKAGHEHYTRDRGRSLLNVAATASQPPGQAYRKGLPRSASHARVRR
jgi:hypothetical protein